MLVGNPLQVDTLNNIICVFLKKNAHKKIKI